MNNVGMIDGMIDDNKILGIKYLSKYFIFIFIIFIFCY